MQKFLKKNIQAQSRLAERGSILIYDIVMIFIFSLVMLGLLSYATIQLRVIRSSVNREIAFQVAEAGANYYQWHLAHFATDFWDGNASTTPGPYVHDYIDKDTNQIIGRYSLTITPPAVGSTIVTIQSTGYTLNNTAQKRTVTVRYGVPSLAQYAFLTNSDAWIGDTETVNGQFHTNGGVRFDGTGNAPIYSSKSTYTCQSWSGSPCPASKPGIWGDAPQQTKNFWQYPVPNVDFSSMTSDLSSLKSKAQTAGLYLAPSTKQGYSLVFKSDGTFDVYKVTSLKTGQPTGYDVNGNAHNNSLDYNARSFVYNKPIPANGVVYIEDVTWVEGTVKGRVMVVAAKLPYNSSSAPDIIIPNNIVYNAKDGTNSLGLLSQQDILVSYLSPNNLEINAALIAQNGSAQRYNWNGNIKNLISIYGTVASYGTWTWSWVNGSGNTTSGYTNTSTVYDPNLLYSPPPSFPLSSSGYQQISWTSN
ncbi:MAG: pilus assembly PilX N-terminal domain-containing protein [Candidatus Doudnabacteria bacterium]|nr:pilus assembly PilX N-terminal domain-containing protein [Candidatus Doudnabacteria bacterium]